MVFWAGNNLISAALGGVGKISDIHRLWLPCGELESRSQAGVVCSVVEAIVHNPRHTNSKKITVRTGDNSRSTSQTKQSTFGSIGGPRHEGGVLKCKRKRCRENITA